VSVILHRSETQKRPQDIVIRSKTIQDIDCGSVAWLRHGGSIDETGTPKHSKYLGLL
jgi:hypothetical protein